MNNPSFIKCACLLLLLLAISLAMGLLPTSEPVSDDLAKSLRLSCLGCDVVFVPPDEEPDDQDDEPPAGVPEGEREGEMLQERCPAVEQIAPLETALHAAIDSERRNKGLRGLETDACLMYVARAHSRDMADHDYCSHTNLSGQGVAGRLDAFGVAWRACGEILSCQPACIESVADVSIAGWMQSPSHRRNILNKDYTHVGAGLEYNSNGDYYITVVFARY